MNRTLDQLSFKDRPVGWARRAVEGAKVVFTPLALAFLAYFGWHARATLATVFEQARPGWLAAAVMLWMLLHFYNPVFPTLIFRACGSRISYRKAFGIYARRLPGRYLPGGIWQTVGRAVDYHDHGIQPRHLAAFMAMETVSPPLMTFMLGGIGLSFFDADNAWIRAAVLSAAAAVAGLAVVPVVINGRFLKAPDRLSLPVYLKVIGLLCIYWLIAAAAFTCYVAAFPAMSPHFPALEVGATYLFAWGVGYVAVFAPQGIGVFELVAGHMLHTPVSLGGTAALLAGFRAVVLVADLLVWTLSFLGAREARGRAPERQR